MSGNEKAPSDVGAFGIVVADATRKLTFSINEVLRRKTADRFAEQIRTA